MSLCGVVAEYNPFHQGHLYQLSEARRRSGCDFVAVAMSGPFVQRGEPAGWDKWTRARWALCAGADVVFELPAAYCLQAAPGFAFGGVGTLAATGLLTHLSFGSECADVEKLSRIASLEESAAFRTALKVSLSAGKSYPAARFDAACALLPRQEAALLKRPNFLLGVEYLRALSRLAPGAAALPIARRGSEYHAAEPEGTFSSATALRRALSAGETTGLADALPACSRKEALRQPPATLEGLTLPLLYRLRTASPEALQETQGVDEGIESPLWEAGRACSLGALIDRCKSKRYTLARTQRMLLSVLAGFSKDLCASANEGIPYLRVLGLRRSAAPLLGELSRHAGIPLLLRAADEKKLSEKAQALLALDRRANDIAALAFSPPLAARRDYTEPVIWVD